MYKSKIWYIKNESGCIWTREDYGGVMEAPFFRSRIDAKKFIHDYCKQNSSDNTFKRELKKYKVCDLPCKYDVDIA